MSSYQYIPPTASITSTMATTSTTAGLLNSGITLTAPSNSLLNNSVISITGSNGMSYDDLKPATLEVKGNSVFHHDAQFHGNIKVGGRDLKKCLENIEARLNILRPNHDLESEWDELRELGERYRQMERDMLEKLALVDTLKKKL